LTLLFGLSFIVVATLVVLYAAGYRYNFSEQKLEKVGLLYVTSDPKDTRISINGQDHTVGGELVLRSLPAGVYDITASREGYHTWKNKIEIFEGDSFSINDLILFKEAELEPFEIFTNGLVFLGAGEDYLFFQSKEFLMSYDQSSNTVTETNLENGNQVQNVIAGLDGKVYLQQGNVWFQIDLTKDEKTNISKYLPKGTLTLRESNKNLLALNDAGIWSVDLENQLAATLFIKQPLSQDVLQDNDQFWIVATEPAKQRSFLYSLEDLSSRPHLVTSLPYSSSYIVTENFAGFLTIHDQANNILYLVDTETEEATVESLFGVHTWEWSENQQQLLTATEFEITIHHFNDGLSQELLLRLSTPITSVAWYPGETHVFFINENKLSLVERNIKNEINVYQLTETKNNLRILQIDQDGLFIKLTSDSSDKNLASVFWNLELREARGLF